VGVIEGAWTQKRELTARQAKKKKETTKINKQRTSGRFKNEFPGTFHRFAGHQAAKFER